MKHVRITSSLRKSIVDALYARTGLEKRIAEAEESLSKSLHAYIVNLIGPDFAEIEKHCKKLSKIAGEIKCNSDGISFCSSALLNYTGRIYCHFEQQGKETSRSQYVNLPAPIPNFFSLGSANHFSHQNLGKDKYYDAVFVAFKLTRNLDAEKKKVVSELESWLAPYTSTKRLVEDMPDVAPILAALLGSEAPKTLPAVQLQDLKAMLENYGVIPA